MTETLPWLVLAGFILHIPRLLIALAVLLTILATHLERRAEKHKGKR